MRLFTLICFITIGSTFSQDELMVLLDDTSQELFPVIATKVFFYQKALQA